MTEATQGPLICDVAYPLNAPGSAYDPTLIPGQTNNTAVVSAESTALLDTCSYHSCGLLPIAAACTLQVLSHLECFLMYMNSCVHTFLCTSSRTGTWHCGLLIMSLW